MSEEKHMGQQVDDLLQTYGLTDHVVNKGGRPRYHQEPCTKQNFFLTENLAEFITDTVNAMKANTRGYKDKTNIDRSKLLRGILRGLQQSGLKLEDMALKDEYEVTGVIKRHLEAGMKAG